MPLGTHLLLALRSAAGMGAFFWSIDRIHGSRHTRNADHQIYRHPDMARKKSKSNIWAEKIRCELLLFLGGYCKLCGATKNLEFDHVVPIDWTPSAKSQSQRAAEYKREFAKGNLQILCSKCHGKKTAEFRGFEVDPDNCPF